MLNLQHNCRTSEYIPWECSKALIEEIEELAFATPHFIEQPLTGSMKALPALRAQIRKQFAEYCGARFQGIFKRDLLKLMLRCLGMHRIQNPDHEIAPITCFNDLCRVVRDLPLAKHKRNSNHKVTETGPFLRVN